MRMTGVYGLGRPARSNEESRPGTVGLSRKWVLITQTGFVLSKEDRTVNSGPSPGRSSSVEKQFLIKVFPFYTTSPSSPCTYSTDEAK